MTAEPVLFDSIPAGEYLIGTATLNNGARLNSLDVRMIELLQGRLEEWAADERIAMVVLQASGDRAFCAGGDIRNMVEAIAADDLTVAERYFAAEYRLDHTVHTFPKPMLAWCQGVVMGGGLGLMQGASHRVVTTDVMLAMPEISIGLFPDVGAAWFLQRMPARTGLFCALTGTRLDGRDACRTGLADYVMAPDRHGTILGRLPGLPLGPDPELNHEILSQFLAGMHEPQPASPLLERIDAINALTDHRDPPRLRAALEEASGRDEWFRPCLDRVLAGSPTTFALILEQFRRCRQMSLGEVLQMDLVIAMRCCRHPDFPEGVRALLLDKDKNPRWSPGRLEDVDRADLETFFRAPWQGPGPLGDLA